MLARNTPLKAKTRLSKQSKKGKANAANWTRVKSEVGKRDGGKCLVEGCGRPTASHHHVKPRGRGGRDEAQNIVSLCFWHDNAEVGPHANNPEIARYWLRYWERWATEKYPEYWKGAMSL